MIILPIYGTRPEAIKMAPLVLELRSLKLWTVPVAVTGQHREMLDQVNNLFGITPEFDLDIIPDIKKLTLHWIYREHAGLFLRGILISLNCKEVPSLKRFIKLI